MQDEIIPHLEPGRLPSTVDPDAVPRPDKGKKIPQRAPRISAWKLAKLDSNEAIKAAAKARASSSVLRPIGSQPHAYNGDYLSSTSVSGRSSPISTDHGFNIRNAKAGTSKLSPSKSSYPPSRASREDLEACHQSVSSLSSPHVSSFAPALPAQRFPTRDLHNPIYQSSTEPSLLSEKQSRGNEPVSQIPTKRNNSGSAAENMRSTVVWDQEAGRFVSTSSRDGVSSSQVSGTELLYTGQSIFFGGPIVNDQPSNRSTRSNSKSLVVSLERGSQYQLGRSQSGGQLPVFVPSDHEQNQFPSRLPW